MPVKSPPMVGNKEMTKEQFKQWFMQAHDADNDGKISPEELAAAISAAGGWFSRWKGKRGVRSADMNCNGFIDNNELDKLASFAEKHLGIKIIG